MSLVKTIAELGKDLYRYCENPYLLFNCYIANSTSDLAYKEHIEKMAGFNPKKVEEISKHLIERQRKLLETLSRDGYTTKSATFVAKTPLLVGLGIPHPTENGFFFRQPYGFPTIPATSIKGVGRYYAEHLIRIEKSELDHIFGSQESTGSIVFFDAIPESFRFKQEIQNPHYGDYYSSKGKTPPADYLDPVPISFLAVERGAKFFISLASKDSTLADKAWEIIKSALSLIGVGAKTRVGYGILEVSK